MTAGKEKEKVEDVEMKDAEEEKVEKKDPNLLSVEDVREHCKLIRRSVETKEVHFSLDKNCHREVSLAPRLIYLFIFRLGSCCVCCALCRLPAGR